MSSTSPKENELVVQNTDLVPVNPSDKPSNWQKLVDAIRASVGLKPLYLAERWTTAKIRNEEANADVKLLAAHAQYELATAEANRIKLQAEGKYEKDMAIAEFLRDHTTRTVAPDLLRILLDAETRSPDDCASDLQSIIRKIQLLGGVVEIETSRGDDAQ